MNGIDDDCDEDIDEDFLTTDVDRDGLVDIDEYNIHMTEWQDADTDDDGMNDGYELFFGTNPLFADLDNDGDGLRWFQDCDDNNSNISPYSTETRNGIDDNCNGEIDEGLPTLDPQILIVSYSSQTAEVNRYIVITAYANADTETILFEFDASLQVDLSINKATITATVPGIYRGEVCAVTDDVFGCESIVVELTAVEEEEVTPTTKAEPEERSTYVSQLSENVVTVVVLSVLLLLVTIFGWKRPKSPIKWEQPVTYDSSIPAAPDLSMWNN